MSFRGVSFLRPKSCLHVMVLVCLCQTACVWRSKKNPVSRPQRHARNVTSSLPYRPCVMELARATHVLGEVGKLRLFVSIAAAPYLVCKSSKRTRKSPSHETRKGVRSSSM